MSRAAPSWGCSRARSRIAPPPHATTRPPPALAPSVIPALAAGISPWRAPNPALASRLHFCHARTPQLRHTRACRGYPAVASTKPCPHLPPPLLSCPRPPASVIPALAAGIPPWRAPNPALASRLHFCHTRTPPLRHTRACRGYPAVASTKPCPHLPPPLLSYPHPPASVIPAASTGMTELFCAGQRSRRACTRPKRWLL